MLQGCSTYVSKKPKNYAFPSGSGYNQIGHPYSGISAWAGAGVCDNSKEIYNGVTSGNPYKAGLYIVMTPYAVVLIAFDLFLTVAVDTVMLPIDLMTRPTRKRATLKEYCYRPPNRRV